MLSRIILPALLVVTLGGCVSQGTYNQEVQQANTYATQSRTYQALSAQLQKEIQADQVRIKELQGQLTVTLIDEILFASGSAEMHAQGRSTLEKIIGTLQTVPDKRINVRGYTDNEPIGPALRARYPSNWELSTARSTSVVKYLISKGVPSNRLVAAGFGEYQPIAEGDSPEARAQNRRIELKLTER